MVAQIETEPTFSAQTPEPLFGVSGYAMSESAADARPFDLAPDGDRFIFRKSDESVDGLIFVQNWHQELKRLVLKQAWSHHVSKSKRINPHRHVRARRVGALVDSGNSR